MTESILLRKTLTEAVAELGGARRLSVVEVAPDGVTVFDLHRDETGTPRGHGRPVVRWADPVDGPSWDDPGASGDRETVLEAVNVSADTTVVLVGSSPGSPRADEAMELLRAAHPKAFAFTRAGMPVGRLLREIVADEPLRRSYELVVLRRHPVTNRLELTCTPLFEIEARRGTSFTFTVRCEPSDEWGTAFAVVAWQDRRPALLSVHTAKVQPGRYEITAELERPGLVRFSGLPGLARGDRSWAEWVAAVPYRLDPSAGPAHLICAVETSGTAARVLERFRRIGQMITAMSGGLDDRLQVSLIAYGTHSYQRNVPEEPVDVAGWQVSTEHARHSLERLEERVRQREAEDRGYADAAMVEDMLAEVARRLPSSSQGRTALLTVGDRPPHPPRVHRSHILPCPRRFDWEQEVRRLEQHPDLVFGAICDRPPGRADPVWSRLGRAGLVHLDGAVDVHGLGADLGLTASQVQPIPFPLLEVP
ncbi:hypothetical protein AB0395_27195 [Streptosporangium sp. NPDC051023]|uniref:PspA/IM30 family protein n=1 Tax=Streptosporangium sp. NPDC051023 TaxID=3155410 RepID=UPI00344E72BB